MIPFGRETVTLYHRTEAIGADGRTNTLWTRVTLNGCSWRRTGKHTLTSHTDVQVEEVVCRIPADQTCPTSGDVLIPGMISDAAASALDVTRILDRYRDLGAFRVASVADNARPGVPLPHYVAKGEKHEDRLGVIRSQT